MADSSELMRKLQDLGVEPGVLFRSKPVESVMLKPNIMRIEVTLDMDQLTDEDRQHLLELLEKRTEEEA